MAPRFLEKFLRRWKYGHSQLLAFEVVKIYEFRPTNIEHSIKMDTGQSFSFAIVDIVRSSNLKNFHLSMVTWQYNTIANTRRFFHIMKMCTIFNMAGFNRNQCLFLNIEFAFTKPPNINHKVLSYIKLIKFLLLSFHFFGFLYLFGPLKHSTFIMFNLFYLFHHWMGVSEMEKPKPPSKTKKFLTSNWRMRMNGVFCFLFRVKLNKIFLNNLEKRFLRCSQINWCLG